METINPGNDDEILNFYDVKDISPEKSVGMRGPSSSVKSKKDKSKLIESEKKSQKCQLQNQQNDPDESSAVIFTK